MCYFTFPTQFPNQVARDSARITHAHISGVCGALLQSMAVKQALLQPVGTLQPVEFVDNLLEKIGPFEKLEEDHSGSQQKSQSSEM